MSHRFVKAAERELLEAELFIAECIADEADTNLVGIFDGITEPNDRRENMRRAIIRHCLEAVPIKFRGRVMLRNGKPETYGQFFERKYRQPL